MIFCLPALASLSGKQPYSATFGLRGWPVPLTPKAKRYFLRVTIVGGNAHEEILLRCAQKSNHLTNLQIAYVLTLSLYLLIPLPTYNNSVILCSCVIVFGGKARGDTEREF